MSNTTVNGTAVAIVTSHGTGQGFYRQKGGFLSDQKKLYDGFYYQEFSYDVISSLQLDKYSEILKKVVHTAGFIFFGTLEYISVIETTDQELTLSSVTTEDFASETTEVEVLARDGSFILNRGGETIIIA